MDYSPGLAIGTALFEIAVAVWALRGPGERSIIRTTGAILVLLATYQIIEVSICANPAAAGFLPRLAFIAVTWAVTGSRLANQHISGSSVNAYL